jgi:hypothetical protein
VIGVGDGGSGWPRSSGSSSRFRFLERLLSRYVRSSHFGGAVGLDLRACVDDGEQSSSLETTDGPSPTHAKRGKRSERGGCGSRSPPLQIKVAHYGQKVVGKLVGSKCITP